jgi:hypothetical protein
MVRVDAVQVSSFTTSYVCTYVRMYECTNVRTVCTCVTFCMSESWECLCPFSLLFLFWVTRSAMGFSVLFLFSLFCHWRASTRRRAYIQNWLLLLLQRKTSAAPSLLLDQYRKKVLLVEVPEDYYSGSSGHEKTWQKRHDYRIERHRHDLVVDEE